MIAALIGVVLTAFVLQWSSLRYYKNLDQLGQERLELYTSTLEAAIAKFEYLPFILSSGQEAKGLLRQNAVDVADLQQRVNKKLQRWKTESSAADLYLMNAQGIVVASSNWQSSQSFVGRDYGFRPYFKASIAGESSHFFAIGYTTKKPGIFLSYPIFDNQNIIGVAVVKLDLSVLEGDWMAGGETVMVADSAGVIFLTSKLSWKYHSLSPLSAAVRKELYEARKYSGQEIQSLDVLSQSESPSGKAIYRLRKQGAGKFSEYLFHERQIESLGWRLYYISNLHSLKKQQRQIILFGVLCTGLIGLLGITLLVRFQSQASRKVARRQLAASEKRQRQIIADTQAGLITTDENQVICFANPTVEGYFQVESGTLEGKLLADWIYASDRAKLKALYSSKQDDDGKARREPELLGLRSSGQPFPLEVAVCPIMQADGARFLVTLHDISELKHAEQALQLAHDKLEDRVHRRTEALNNVNTHLVTEIKERTKTEDELRRMQQELIQAGKLAALGQMSAGIAHEVNQPLSAMRTFLASVRLLLERGEIDTAKQNLGDIESMVIRVASIVGHLKTFATKSKGRVTQVVLDQVVDNALILMEPRLRKESVTLDWQAPNPPIRVLGDEIKLEQILINLIRNAVDAMREVTSKHLEIEVGRDDKHAWLLIRDSGPGIDEDVLPQVFDPFFTTKETGEGLGLGLSVSYGIAKEFGGDLRASNRPEGGAEFGLYLDAVIDL